jgi:hypothetical protein
MSYWKIYNISSYYRVIIASKSRVGITTGCGLGGRDSILLSTACRPALRPTQSPTQLVPWAFSAGVKRPGREADHLFHLVPRSRVVELHLHSPLRLHGKVLNWLSTRITLPLTRESRRESRYDRQSVDQSVLATSPVWSSWPDIKNCLTLTVLLMSGVPSDGRSGLSFVVVIVRPLLVNIYRFTCNAHDSDIYKQYIQGLCQSRLRTADHALS